MNKVTIPDKVREEICLLRTDPQAPNMFDCNAVQRLANDLGCYELVCFIEENRRAYATFLLTGQREVEI